MVIFDKDRSNIVNKKTGTVTPLETRDGSYEFDLWVTGPASNQESGIEDEGRYDITSRNVQELEQEDDTMYITSRRAL